MWVQADSGVCIGSGNCARTAAATFTQDETDGIVVLLDPDPPADQRAAVRVAAEQCPVGAILLNEPG
jgi:ferredoxin